MAIKNTVPEGFSHPALLPDSPEKQKAWQEANKLWWESNPMRYDWKDKIDYEEFTKPFFEEIDSRFFQDAKVYIPFKNIPFDYLIDFNSLSLQDVLEIGVGNGSHARLLAEHSRSFTGIDLTEYAVKSVSKRMECFGLNGNIAQMDAEAMKFDDASFDFVWSWGV
ncbi:MAG: class I SAM-dependent methyltransferase, partial [Candidatus Omnitrophota bacterium]